MLLRTFCYHKVGDLKKKYFKVKWLLRCILIIIFRIALLYKFYGYTLLILILLAQLLGDLSSVECLITLLQFLHFLN